MGVQVSALLTPLAFYSKFSRGLLATDYVRHFHEYCGFSPLLEIHCILQSCKSACRLFCAWMDHPPLTGFINLPWEERQVFSGVSTLSYLFVFAGRQSNAGIFTSPWFSSFLASQVNLTTWRAITEKVRFSFSGYFWWLGRRVNRGLTRL